MLLERIAGRLRKFGKLASRDILVVSDLPNGSVVQAVNVQDGAVATGSTTMPVDDTIPQITEGDEYMTLAITPKATSNLLLITVDMQLASDSVGDDRTSAALFQDTTANALASAMKQDMGTDLSYRIHFSHKMTAGTVSSTTFRARAGGAAAGTTTFNGFGAARKHGDVISSSITILEIAA